jgi:hypothetical protein
MRMTAQILALLFTLAFMVIATKFSLTSKWGGPAVFTFVIANQDMPSGIYYERDFDWPTGEALWLDIPVEAVDAILLMTAVFFWRFAFKPRQDKRSSPVNFAAVTRNRPAG